jgi:predicted CoA-substrate-specific enzyme activase
MIMFVGLDLGSSAVKIARKDKDGSFILASYDTFDFYRRYSLPVEGGFALDLEALALEGAVITACGYGRQAAALTGAEAISEIQAHALGAMRQSGRDDFLLLDLGGQDTKIVRVKGGRAVDFSTNDKCAAGSGRYLFNMANILGISLQELGMCKEDPAQLSATCAVFGESELVGEIIKGTSLTSLAAGINYSVVKRILPLLARHLPAPAILFSGGVAQNHAVVQLLSEALAQTVEVLPEPRFNGAIGCYYHAAAA